MKPHPTPAVPPKAQPARQDGRKRHGPRVYGRADEQGCQKGVLITTSSFSKTAMNVAANQSGHVRVVLIDGGELKKLMVRFGVGVRIARTVEIKSIDQEYFDDGEPE
jgi:restriction endonuclease Mrr